MPPSKYTWVFSHSREKTFLVISILLYMRTLLLYGCPYCHHSWNHHSTLHNLICKSCSCSLHYIIVTSGGAVLKYIIHECPYYFLPKLLQHSFHLFRRIICIVILLLYIPIYTHRMVKSIALWSDYLARVTITKVSSIQEKHI